MGKRLALLALVGCAYSSTVTHPANPGGQPATNEDGSKTYSYLVKPETIGGELEIIKDFHLWCEDLNGKKKKMKGTRGGGPSTWTNNMSGGGHNWGGSGAVPTGGTTFTVNLTKDDEFKDALIKWKTTGDGDLNPDDPLDWGPGYDSGGNPDAAIHGPIVKSDVVGPFNAPPGLCSISIDTSEPGIQFTVFAVSEDADDAPDPFVDYQGFVTWCNAHAVNPEIRFANMSGLTDSHGDSDAPTVTVPNDPLLVGTKFYLLVVIDHEGDKVTTNVQEVTIVAP